MLWPLNSLETTSTLRGASRGQGAHACKGGYCCLAIGLYMWGGACGSLEVCLCIRRSVWVAHVARMQMGLVYNLQCAGGKSILKLPAQGQKDMACLLAREKQIRCLLTVESIRY